MRLRPFKSGKLCSFKEKEWTKIPAAKAKSKLEKCRQRWT